MLFLERGRARLAASDPDGARDDIEAAVRPLTFERYKAEARRELARLPGTKTQATPGRVRRESANELMKYRYRLNGSEMIDEI